MDVSVAEAFVDLPRDVLGGQVLERTKGSVYKLGDRKIFCAMVDGEVKVRSGGAYVGLKEYLLSLKLGGSSSRPSTRRSQAGGAPEGSPLDEPALPNPYESID